VPVGVFQFYTQGIYPVFTERKNKLFRRNHTARYSKGAGLPFNERPQTHKREQIHGMCKKYL
jgi:hypothetical protein